MADGVRAFGLLQPTTNASSETVSSHEHHTVGVIGCMIAVGTSAPQVFQPELQTAYRLKHTIDRHILSVTVSITTERLLIIQTALAIGSRHEEFA